MPTIPVLFLVCILILQLSSANANHLSSETYIVHVDAPDTQLLSEQSQDLESWYLSFLPATPASSTESPRMVYSYRNVFSGFAAKLTSEEVKAMQGKKGFVSARPQQVLQLHTTHTPNFLGLHQNAGLWKDSNYGKGIVIGILALEYFPIILLSVTKIIGARHFKTGDGTPLDHEGHGTHAASTAADNFVRGANVFGNANGTAVGIAPLAHLAIYKVCSLDCAESDILAAMDMAIEDGVDVLSISFGGYPRELHNDDISLGAFSAMKKGIFVSCSAGNSGPYNFTLSNDAPWILTVGASTIDRTLRATAVLGSKLELNGESAFQPKAFPLGQLPLVYPGTIGSDFSFNYCDPESLNRTGVKGKIVLCYVANDIRTTKIEQGGVVKEAGGAAMILMNIERDGFTTSADAHVIPATHINYEDGEKILAYMNSTSAPTATIVFKGTIIGDKRAPTVAAFSSRGPSTVSRAGHVNAAKASDPGLIYDIEPQDYIPYLCGLGYTSREVSKFVLRRVNCSEVSAISSEQLNYPSFAVNRFGSSNQTFTRTVTNVGEDSSSYTVEVVSPQDLNVTVNPRTLNFSKLNQKLTYEVSFSLPPFGGEAGASSQGYILWKSAKHSVRSPVAYYY
ncbi:UNVERIFIED_CONTAM: Subtilisin-like protease SBT1.7 [Sesamum latifolium]|uniref:Subtilisin-like protease SBT1.7 n=1 Tax=Sesamum latifolium TaxID=2727402 RepID=A0AAW2WZL2_9LAMI